MTQTTKEVLQKARDLYAAAPAAGTLMMRNGCMCALGAVAAAEGRLTKFEDVEGIPYEDIHPAAVAALAQVLKDQGRPYDRNPAMVYRANDRLLGRHFSGPCENGVAGMLDIFDKAIAAQQ